MKLLFDQHLSFKLAKKLEDLFPGSNQVRLASSDLLRKFTEIAFDDSAQFRWQESQRAEEEDTGREPEIKELRSLIQ